MFSYPYGIMVDTNGRMFVDEGEDVLQPHIRKTWAEVLRLPGKMAFQIFDQKSRALVAVRIQEQDSAVSADSIESLGRLLPSLNGKILLRRSSNSTKQCRKVNLIIEKRWQHTQNITPCEVEIGRKRLELTSILCVHPLLAALPLRLVDYESQKKRKCVIPRQHIQGLFAAAKLQAVSFYHNYPGGFRTDEWCCFWQDRWLWRSVLQ
jgi:tricarballylate dehydrogenase